MYFDFKKFAIVPLSSDSEIIRTAARNTIATSVFFKKSSRIKKTTFIMDIAEKYLDILFSLRCEYILNRTIPIIYSEKQRNTQASPLDLSSGPNILSVSCA